MVLVPFGFSVGDFIAAIELIKDLSIAFQETGGAADDFRKTLAQLEALGGILEQLENLQPAFSSPTIVNAIRAQAKLLNQSVQDFLRKIGKYRTKLGTDAPVGRSPALIAKTRWTFVSKAVIKLHDSVQAQVVTLGLLLQFMSADSASILHRQLLETESTLTKGLKASDSQSQQLGMNVLQLHDTVRQLSTDLTTSHDALRVSLEQRLNTLQSSQPASSSSTSPSTGAILRQKTAGSSMEDMKPGMLIEVHATVQEILNTMKSAEARLALLSRQPDLDKCSQNWIRKRGESRSGLGTSLLMTEQLVRLRTPDIDQITLKELEGDSKDESIENDAVEGSFQSAIIDSFQASILQALYGLISLFPQIIPFLRRLFALPISPTNLLMDNILFEDVLGRTHSLQYEYIKEWSVFKAILDSRFKGLPGSGHVAQGYFRIMNARFQNKMYDESNWSQSVFPGTKLAMAVLIKARKVPPGRCIHRNCDGEAQTIGAGRRMCKSCGVTFQQDLPLVSGPLVKPVSLHQEDTLGHTSGAHLPFGINPKPHGELMSQLSSSRSRSGTVRNTRTTQSIRELGKAELDLGHSVQDAKPEDSDRKGILKASTAISISAVEDSLVSESSKSHQHRWVEQEWTENEEGLMVFRRIHISQPVPVVLRLPPLKLSRESERSPSPPSSATSSNGWTDSCRPISVYYSETGVGMKRLSLLDYERRIESYQTFKRGDRPWGRYANLRRRTSHDEHSAKARQFVFDVYSTHEHLLCYEDLDGDSQITIDDEGPKVISLGSLGVQVISLGSLVCSSIRSSEIRGNYAISNLLQELTLALHAGRRYLIIDDSNLNENPVRRLTRQMKEFYWKNLTQVTNGANLEKVLQDPKDWTPRPRPRIYIPRSQPFLHDYYTSLAQQQPSCDLDVQWLPSNDIPAFAAGKYEHPGLVVLSHREAAANRDENGETSIRSVPFVVPHGHAHEFHGWQSYSTFLGLLAQDETDLAEAMIENYCFCIHHYGRVPQSGRLHHMTQSQPPFLTSMALSLYNKLSDRASALKMLETAIAAAIKEYYTVWMAPPRWDPVSRLSRYASEGTTIPQEEELAPFVPILKPLAERRNLTIDEFVIAYNSRQILEPELDEYLRHYRASMESGHHRSNRMEGVAADIATVDLNCLLYKYEVDIADAISTCFSGRLDVPVDYSYPYESGFQPPGRETSAKWRVYAHNRQVCMNKFMWDEWQGMYFDYNTKTFQRTSYESVTTFWALWAGVSRPAQAAEMAIRALPEFEADGGLLSGTRRSRGEHHLNLEPLAWDYPNGWAIHQMLAWDGLVRYGYTVEAHRLAYKWLYMVTTVFHDYNGVVTDQYDITRRDDAHRSQPHSRIGKEFKGVNLEGYAPTNASYIYGLRMMTVHMRRALENLIPWTLLDRMTQIKLEEDIVLHEESDDSQSTTTLDI